MREDLIVDPNALREKVRDKYREVATDAHRTFHFHTGRPLAARLGYDQAVVDALPDRAVESFAGVGNPFSLRLLQPGEHVVDVGSGAGLDSFIAAGQVGAAGRVVGVDMTPEMLTKSRATAEALRYGHVEFREGLAEQLPVESGWADAVISNGVINLCADKKAVFAEVYRVLRPGGWLLGADCVEPTLAVRTDRDQPGVLEHVEVSGDGLLGDIEMNGDVVDRTWLVAHVHKHFPTPGLGERCERCFGRHDQIIRPIACTS